MFHSEQVQEVASHFRELEKGKMFQTIYQGRCISRQVEDESGGGEDERSHISRNTPKSGIYGRKLFSSTFWFTFRRFLWNAKDQIKRYLS